MCKHGDGRAYTSYILDSIPRRHGWHGDMVAWLAQGADKISKEKSWCSPHWKPQQLCALMYLLARERHQKDWGFGRSKVSRRGLTSNRLMTILLLGSLYTLTKGILGRSPNGSKCTVATQAKTAHTTVCMCVVWMYMYTYTCVNTYMHIPKHIYVTTSAYT